MAGDRFTFTAEASLDPLSPWAFYRDEARKPPQLRAGVSLPLLFQETQAQATRSLLFTEDQRRRLRLAAARKGNASPSEDTARAGGNLPVDLDALSLGRNLKDGKEADLLNDILGDKDKEILERRQKIRAELKDIEDLLP